MRLTIEDFCIRCGICVTLYPELYEMDFDEDVIRIKVNEISGALTAKARESIKDCAVAAIRLEKL
jgi:ferredoxin